MKSIAMNSLLGTGLSVALLLGLSAQPTQAQPDSQNAFQIGTEACNNSSSDRQGRHDGHQGHGDHKPAPKPKK